MDSGKHSPQVPLHSKGYTAVCSGGKRDHEETQGCTRQDTNEFQVGSSRISEWINAFLLVWLWYSQLLDHNWLLGRKDKDNFTEYINFLPGEKMALLH